MAVDLKEFTDLDETENEVLKRVEAEIDEKLRAAIKAAKKSGSARLDFRFPLPGQEAPVDVSGRIWEMLRQAYRLKSWPTVECTNTTDHVGVYIRALVTDRPKDERRKS